MLVFSLRERKYEIHVSGVFFRRTPFILYFVFYLFIFSVFLLCIYVFCWVIQSEALIENGFLDQALDRFLRNKFYCKLMESKLMEQVIMWIIVFVVRNSIHFVFYRRTVYLRQFGFINLLVKWHFRRQRQYRGSWSFSFWNEVMRSNLLLYKNYRLKRRSKESKKIIFKTLEYYAMIRHKSVHIVEYLNLSWLPSIILYSLIFLFDYFKFSRKLRGYFLSTRSVLVTTYK